MTGASGLVGTAVSALATKRGHEVAACYNTGLPLYGAPKRIDLAKPSELVDLIRAIKPVSIIHTAALTDVDECELQPELAEQVNGAATGEIAKAARDVSAHLTYVSTDYVFGGEEGNYNEEATPNPLSHYGRSKLLGEKLLIESKANCCIARPSVIYGWGRPKKPNFGLFVVNSLEEKREIKAAHELYCSPTLNTNLSEMLLEIATRKLTGILHVSGATRASRFEFARVIANEFELNSDLIKQTDWKNLRLRANRPRDSSLNVQKAVETLTAKPSNLNDALRSFSRNRASMI